MAKNKRVSQHGVGGKGEDFSRRFGKLSDAEYKELWKKHPIKKKGKNYVRDKEWKSI